MPAIPFELKTEYIELHKLLKLLSLCESGGEAKLAVSEGRVRVGGNVETRKAFKVRSGQVIEFEGQVIEVR